MSTNLPVNLHLIPTTYVAMLRIMRFRPTPIPPGCCAFCRASRGDYNAIIPVGIGRHEIRTKVATKVCYSANKGSVNGFKLGLGLRVQAPMGKAKWVCRLGSLRKVPG